MEHQIQRIIYKGGVKRPPPPSQEKATAPNKRTKKEGGAKYQKPCKCQSNPINCAKTLAIYISFKKVDPRTASLEFLRAGYFDALYTRVQCAECKKIRNFLPQLQLSTDERLMFEVGCVRKEDVMDLERGNCRPGDLGYSFVDIVEWRDSRCPKDLVDCIKGCVEEKPGRQGNFIVDRKELTKSLASVNVDRNVELGDRNDPRGGNRGVQDFRRIQSGASQTPSNQIYQSYDSRTAAYTGTTLMQTLYPSLPMIYQYGGLYNQHQAESPRGRKRYRSPAQKNYRNMDSYRARPRDGSFEREKRRKSRSRSHSRTSKLRSVSRSPSRENRRASKSPIRESARSVTPENSRYSRRSISRSVSPSASPIEVISEIEGEEEIRSDDPEVEVKGAIQPEAAEAEVDTSSEESEDSKLLREMLKEYSVFL